MKKKKKKSHCLLAVMLMGSRVNFLSPQTIFWSFTAKQCCSILLVNWSIWGLVLKHKAWDESIKLVCHNPVWDLRASRDSDNTLVELYGAISCSFSVVLLFKSSLFPCQLFWRMLHCCLGVKLKKCFADYETSPDHQLAWKWLDDDSNFIFSWTFPLTKIHLNVSNLSR